MKKTNLAMGLFLLLSGILGSCSKKNNTTPVVTTVTYSSMDAVFAMLSVQPKTLSVDALTGGSYYGSSGTRYIFYGNSFMTASGASVTGTVNIQVSEYLQKGDMIFSKMLPVSNSEPLISGGEINAVATQNGQPVYLKAHNYFEANIPQGGVPPTGMLFFSGQPNLDTTILRTNWIQPVTDTTGYNSGLVNPLSDTLGIISDSLKFCNADGFLTAPNYQSIEVTVQASGGNLPTASNTVFGFALYDNYKGVWPIGWYSGNYSNGLFTEHHVPNIPIHFVIFTLISGKFYGGILGVTPATGNNYIVNLVQVDPATFKSEVDQL